MVLGVMSGGGWWQHAEQVVAPWAGAVEEQEPRCLEVVKERDVVQKSLVAGPGLAEVVSLVFWCAKGGSEDSDPRCSGGSAGFPTQTSAPRGCKLGGGTPARFQTRVLPLLSWMRAWV